MVLCSLICQNRYSSLKRLKIPNCFYLWWDEKIDYDVHTMVEFCYFLFWLGKQSQISIDGSNNPCHRSNLLLCKYMYILVIWFVGGLWVLRNRCLHRNLAKSQGLDSILSCGKEIKAGKRPSSENSFVPDAYEMRQSDILYLISLYLGLEAENSVLRRTFLRFWYFAIPCSTGSNYHQFWKNIAR
jgi:hypothetical protein